MLAAGPAGWGTLTSGDFTLVHERRRKVPVVGMSATDELRQQIKHSPNLPGVYLFREATGPVLYVGKALSLRKRLASYLPALEGDAGRFPVKVGEMMDRHL
jgi:hypothetical protein